MPTRDPEWVTWLKWALLIVPFCGFLLSAGGMMWQVNALAKKVDALEAQQRASERALIEIGTTLKIKKVID